MYKTIKDLIKELLEYPSDTNVFVKINVRKDNEDTIGTLYEGESIDDITYNKKENILYLDTVCYIDDNDNEIEQLKEKDKIINNATIYNNYLKEHCSYRLNKGHLRKMEKILKGDK